MMATIHREVLRVLQGVSAPQSESLGSRLEGGDVRQIAVALAMVEPIPDRETIRNLEAHVSRMEVHLASLWLDKKRAYFE